MGQSGFGQGAPGYSDRSENVRWQEFHKIENQNIHAQPTNVNWSCLTNNEYALAKSGAEVVSHRNVYVKRLGQDGLMGKHTIINSLAGYSNVNST